MRFPAQHDLPEELRPVLRRAKRLEWLTLFHMTVSVVLLFFTLGQSQAMRGAWIEDMLSLIPPAAFLIANHFRNQAPNERFPFGYHRATTVAYLVSTVALLTLGGFLMLESIHKLIVGDHPPIGMVELWDTQIWLGWLMLAALFYTGLGTVILGRLKLPVARELHDKVLVADAEMNRADWMTAFAAMGGVVGIGFGLWWADALAATIIGADIFRDGVKYSRRAVGDVADSHPRKADESGPDPLEDKLRELVAAEDWVGEAAIRLREAGHLISGDVFVVPADETGLLMRAERLTERIHDLDWRLNDVVVVPVRSLEGAPDGLTVR